MKLFIVLSALVVAVSAGGYGGNGGSSHGGLSGSSSQFRQDDHYGNYQFGYDESHATGGSSRREEETNGVRRGSYSLTDADGRRRTVSYVADAGGFRATVDTNEPGTESKSPADVIMNGAQLSLVNSGNSAAYGAAPLAQSSYAQAAPLARYTNAVALPAGGYQMAAPVAKSYGYSANNLAPAQIAMSTGYSAPAPIPAPIPVPAPVPLRAYSAPMSTYEAPVKTYSAAPATYEAPTPRAFSYSFSSAHPSQASYGPAYSAPVQMNTYSAPAPIMRAYAAPAPASINTYSAQQYNNNYAATQIEAPRASGYAFNSVHPSQASYGSSFSAGQGYQSMARGGY